MLPRKKGGKDRTVLMVPSQEALATLRDEEFPAEAMSVILAVRMGERSWLHSARDANGAQDDYQGVRI